MNPGEREEIRIGQWRPISGRRSAVRRLNRNLRVRRPRRRKVPIAHSHDGYEETIYGLAGVLTLTVNGRPIEVAQGEALCVPRGVVHGFEQT